MRDRTGGGARFESSLVPAYVRRAAAVDAALPWLYLRGISQADIGPALKELVGPEAANLSAPVISRLKFASLPLTLVASHSLAGGPAVRLC